jgi:hypothetical protein
MDGVGQLAANELQHFDAPASEVWLYRLDFTNLPAYNPAVTHIARATAGSGAGDEAGPGAVYHLTLETPRGSHPVAMTVTRTERDAIVEADMVGAMSAYERFTVTPDPSGSGCVASLLLWLELPDGADGATAAALLDGGRRQIRLELDGMKRQIDG